MVLKGEQKQVCQLFHKAIEIIGKRWTGAVIYALCSGSKRFNEFHDAIPDISDRLLTERLKELEEFGLIKREVTSEKPVQVIYSLTEKGKELEPVLKAVRKWAEKWQ